MKKSPTITKKTHESKALDYAALYREGVEWAQKYAGAVWTDYNVHDPGITLLEYLCYGITDIGYRCSFPVTDLLYARDGLELKWSDNAFFSIDDILPCAPLTKNDYRRLILDHLMEEVDNVWVTSSKSNADGFKGIYDIFVQITPEALGDRSDQKAKEQKVLENVRDLFNANRNLSEDLGRINILRHEYLDIEASISIHGDASAEQVLADIAYRIEKFLTPQPKLYNFEALKEAGMDVNDILDGPIPLNGFTKKDELLRFSLSLRVSQLKDNITSVPGVVDISDFLVKINSVPQRNDEIILPAETYFVLSSNIFSPESNVRLLRNGREVKPNEIEARQQFLAYRAKNLQKFRNYPDLRKPTVLSEKNLADVAAYFSIQRYFPAFYGIGAYGLPSDAGKLRQAQAKQLKGYLAIFEILLAGYLKQLTQVREMFSTGRKAEFVRPKTEPTAENAFLAAPTKTEPTYFTQFPFDIPDVAPLLNFPGMETGDALNESANRYLGELAAQGGRDLERRNTFLNHLLARFAETFDADLLARFSENPGDNDTLQRNLLEAKSRILQEYDVLSRNRGLGFNYIQPGHIITTQTPGGISWATDNVSVLKKNICYRLNLPYWNDRSFTDFFPFKGFGAQPQSREAVQENTVAISLRGLMKDGQNRSNYEIRQAEDAGYTVCFRENQDILKPLFQAKTLVEAEDQLNSFLEELKAFYHNCNGFFIIENLLLRPLHIKGTKLVLKAQLPSQKNILVLESPEFLDAEALENLARDLLLLASKVENFEVRNDEKMHAIVLKSNEKVIMVSRGRYYRDAAEKIVQELVHKIEDTLGNTDFFKANELLEFEVEEINGLKVPLEFYAHRLSIVAPGWAAIFRDQDNRNNFQDLVRQLAPAHLYLDFLYLNWEKMRAFETDYLHWMYEKSSATTTARTIDACSLKLVEHLLVDKTIKATKS